MTYTYVIMEVTKSTFDEVMAKLKAAKYDHAIHERGHNGYPVLDLHGIALGVEAQGAKVPQLKITDGRNKRWRAAERRIANAMRGGKEMSLKDLKIVGEEQDKWDKDHPEEEVPDRFCVTTPDGGCKSVDKRDMHAPSPAIEPSSDRDTGFSMPSEDESNTSSRRQKQLWRCQFCDAETPPKEWKDDQCPKCGRKYDAQMAQDSEE